MVLSLAASENISLVTRRKIQQNTSTPLDIKDDFTNFPTINSKNSRRNSYKNTSSDSNPTFFQVSNRFSILNSHSKVNEVFEGVPSMLLTQLTVHLHEFFMEIKDPRSLKSVPTLTLMLLHALLLALTKRLET